MTHKEKENLDKVNKILEMFDTCIINEDDIIFYKLYKKKIDVNTKIYYLYFKDKNCNGWYNLPYKKFLGHEVEKIKVFKLFTIYNIRRNNYAR